MGSGRGISVFFVFFYDLAHRSVANTQVCGDLAQGIAAFQVRPANELVAVGLATLIGIRVQALMPHTIQLKAT